MVCFGFKEENDVDNTEVGAGAEQCSTLSQGLFSFQQDAWEAPRAGSGHSWDN